MGYVLKTKEISNLIQEFNASYDVDIFIIKLIYIARYIQHIRETLMLVTTKLLV